MLTHRAVERLINGGLLFYTLAFSIFMLAPILIVVIVAFSANSYVSFPIENWSWRWFQRLYEYRPYFDSFVVTLKLAVLSAFFACLLGVPAALVLSRSRGKFANAVMTFMLSPLSIPSIVLGFAMLFYLSHIGLGVSFISLLIAHVVASIPYIVRTVGGQYRSMTPGFEESAMILGCNGWQTFWYVTFPMIRGAILAGAIFALIISIDNVSLSLFFSSPTTATLPVVMLSYLESSFDPSIAAASTVQLIIAVVLLFVIERLYGLRGITG